MNTTTSSSNSNFSCSMDGYVAQVKQFVTIALALISIIKSTGLYLLPTNLAYSVNYFWKFFLSASSWIGYATAAAYYFAMAFNFGSYMCTASGYLQYAITWMYQYVNFGNSNWGGWNIKAMMHFSTEIAYKI